MGFEAAGFGADVVGDAFGVHGAEEGSEEAFGGEGEFDFDAGAVGAEAVVGDHGGAGGFLDPGEGLVRGAFGDFVDGGAEFGLDDAIAGSYLEAVFVAIGGEGLDLEGGGGPGGPAFDVGEDLPDGCGTGIDDDAFDGLHVGRAPPEFSPVLGLERDTQVRRGKFLGREQGGLRLWEMCRRWEITNILPA